MEKPTLDELIAAIKVLEYLMENEHTNNGYNFECCRVASMEISNYYSKLIKID